ncbi:hypothetical protein E1293_21855 [Actinomadura darangshiensis]|uniref:Type II toxin-antitoxin system RelE/ParE family toxin n=1 Tax=Actinomadura darangshiensis TaxID=705336 RepID=A0A4R5B8G9_9ACTN|nr:hypothetical protein [Actinomadura darangshiensis]TDD79994.1 hypothetical protein E1293_21855 [Actinomadura darangshiensis]
MSDWTWVTASDGLLDGLPSEAIKELDLLASELAERDSMLFPDGPQHTGDIPGLRRQHRGPLIITYLSDVRAERIVVVRIVWLA